MQTEIQARFSAYRWFRTAYPDATHAQGWGFSQNSWPRYVSRPRDFDESGVILCDFPGALEPEAIVMAPMEGT